MGGKSRISKDISQVILQHTENRDTYVEPFVGGGSVAEKISRNFDNIILNDLHTDLMLMWDAVLNNGWVPPTEVSYEEYQELRYADESSPLRGFVGFGCSFGGRWFEGYARYKDTNFAQSSHNVVLRQAKAIGEATCINTSFFDVPVSKGDVVYCDPPYEGTKGYKSGQFPHEEFWAKAQEWSELGADVFVSEYSAPVGWKSIWEKETTGQLDPRKIRTKPIEKLFIYEG